MTEASSFYPGGASRMSTSRLPSTWLHLANACSTLAAAQVGFQLLVPQGGHTWSRLIQTPGCSTSRARSPVPAARGGDIEWIELGLAEIEDRFGEAQFDAIVFCLVFSELSPDEQAYALDIARSRLVSAGCLVIADETLPSSRPRRLWYQMRRLPLTAATYILTQASTRPVERVADRIRDAGFGRVQEARLWGDTFFVAHAVREDGGR